MGGYRYSTLPTPPRYHTPGTPPLPHPGTPWHGHSARVQSAELNMAVGLRSVAQLSLYTQISGFQELTEVHNLIRIGRINNHLFICQND